MRSWHLKKILHKWRSLLESGNGILYNLLNGWDVPTIKENK